MDSAAQHTDRRKVLAFTLPMAAFLLLLALAGILKRIGGVTTFLQSPEYWIYPVQTVLGGALLIWFWRHYDFRAPARLIFALTIAVLVFCIWIAPQAFFGSSPRLAGYNPELFSAGPGWYWSMVLFRFLRLVLVVPLVEEIFWRGFLLRYLISEKFYAVPMGTFSWLSFAVVTLGFAFAHASADRMAALITGALYNWVAYRTKSLASCVIAHAVTNLLLGLWIMKTRQWGFW
jgi:CAAX prenyl protease-like protein